jgi:hypothetical protein
VPPPPFARSPAQWGTEARLAELFGGAAREVRAERRSYVFRFASAEHWLDVFRTWYGPVLKAFAALPPERSASLEAEILALLSQHDRGGGAGLVVDATYLEAVITVR